MRTDRFAAVDDLEVHYSEWGESDAPPVVCVHGLSRVGRDFDPLARALEDDYRVVCPDLPGRGLSEWADDEERYTAGAMADLLVGFCDALDLESLSFVGTSLGGRLGTILSAGTLADRISHLVLNDPALEVPSGDAAGDEGGRDRIRSYLTSPPTFDRLTELEGYYRDTYAAMSEQSDREWARFTRTSARRTDGGTVTPNYDTRIVDPLFDEAEGVDEWPVFEGADAEMLVIRAEASDVLHEPVFEEMLDRRPDADSMVVPGGHPPPLNREADHRRIRAFLPG